MEKRLAIVIAVEKYPDTRIRTVKYAEADAEGFAKALEVGGSLDKVFLLSGKATKTTINSQVRQGSSWNSLTGTISRLCTRCSGNPHRRFWWRRTRSPPRATGQASGATRLSIRSYTTSAPLARSCSSRTIRSSRSSASRKILRNPMSP